jgi:hypothetical protein
MMNGVFMTVMEDSKHILVSPTGMGIPIFSPTPSA